MLLLCAIFVLLTAALLLWLPRLLSVRWMVVVLVALGVLLVLLMYLFGLFKEPPFVFINPSFWREFRLRTTLSLLVMISVGAMACVVFPLILRYIIRFHQVFNSGVFEQPTHNFQAQLLHAIIAHQEHIKFAMRLIFFVGTILVLYGVWTI